MVERSLRRRAVLAIVGLVAVSVAVVSPAAADDGVVATETGEALEVAGSLVADAAPLSDVGDDFVAVVEGSVVELPADPAESLVLDGAAGEIGVDLPVVAGLGDGVLDESGAVVYETDSSPVSLAAQATEDGGLQVLVVIDGPDAPTEYRFDMTVPRGAALRATPDGGAEVVGADGQVVTVVAPPWAVDANGESVPTGYQIKGTTLVQVIDHHGAAYPVVGDPKFSKSWWGWTVKLKASEFSKVQAAVNAGAGALAVAAAVCGTSTAGLCAPGSVALAALSGFLWVSISVVQLCANSKGVDIHRSWVGGIWCSGY
jgi:hypothetical protein